MRATILSIAPEQSIISLRGTDIDPNTPAPRFGYEDNGGLSER